MNQAPHNEVYCFDQTPSARVERLRKEAAAMPPGVQQDALLRWAQQIESTSVMVSGGRCRHLPLEHWMLQVTWPPASHSAGLREGYLLVHGFGEVIRDDSATANRAQIFNPLWVGIARSYSASWLGIGSKSTAEAAPMLKIIQSLGFRASACWASERSTGLIEIRSPATTGIVGDVGVFTPLTTVFPEVCTGELDAVVKPRGLPCALSLHPPECTCCRSHCFL